MKRPYFRLIFFLIIGFSGFGYLYSSGTQNRNIYLANKNLIKKGYSLFKGKDLRGSTGKSCKDCHSKAFKNDRKLEPKKGELPEIIRKCITDPEKTGLPKADEDKVKALEAFIKYNAKIK